MELETFELPDEIPIENILRVYNGDEEMIKQLSADINEEIMKEKKLLAEELKALISDTCLQNKYVEHPRFKRMLPTLIIGFGVLAVVGIVALGFTINAVNKIEAAQTQMVKFQEIVKKVMQVR